MLQEPDTRIFGELFLYKRSGLYGALNGMLGFI